MTGQTRAQRPYRSQFLTLTNTALGGGDTGFTFPDLDIELAQLNNAFDDGTVASLFAQDHLVAPGSSVAMPEPPTLLLATLGLLAAAILSKTRASGSSKSDLNESPEVPRR